MQLEAKVGARLIVLKLLRYLLQLQCSAVQQHSNWIVLKVRNRPLQILHPVRGQFKNTHWRISVGYHSFSEKASSASCCVATNLRFEKTHTGENRWEFCASLKLCYLYSKWESKLCILLCCTDSTKASIGYIRKHTLENLVHSASSLIRIWILKIILHRTLLCTVHHHSLDLNS